LIDGEHAPIEWHAGDLLMILDIGFLDDATRPAVPKLQGLTPAQKAGGEHLKAVHDHLRDNMKTIRTLIDRAAEGLASEDEVVSDTASLTMVANFRRFGNLCGEHCQIVNAHHSIEDAHLFPVVAAISDDYHKVAERLAAEHVVVHQLLELQIETLNALAREPSAVRFADARTVFEALERVLASHLGYEEDQIGDALGYYSLA
jgi:hemerythrin-like domain-containing protein